MNAYTIENKLSNNDICQYLFNGKNKQEAIRNYTRETGCPKSSIVSIIKLTY